MVAELGGVYYCLGLEDGFVFDSRDIRLALTEVLRAVAADVVLTLPAVRLQQRPRDGRPDRTTRVAMSAINTIHTNAPALARAPAVLFMDTIVGLDFQPTHYVDISAQFAEKARLLRMHDSQMRSQPNITGWVPLTHADVVGRFRGQQCGVSTPRVLASTAHATARPGWVLPG